MQLAKNKTLALMLLLTLFMTFSCDEHRNELPNEVVPINVNEAENWFKKNYEIFGFREEITVDWNMALVSGDRIEAPFTTGGKSEFPGARSLPKNGGGRKRLQILQTGTSYELLFVSYIPSASNTADMTEVNLLSWESGFSGRIEYANRLTDERKVHYVKDGKIIIRATAGRPEKNESGRTKSWHYWSQDTHWYQYGGGEWFYTGTTTEYWAEWVDDGYNYDYLNYDYNYGDEWGNGGGYGYYQDPFTPTETIYIDLQNECLSRMANRALNSNVESTLNYLIQDIFAVNDKVNLVVVEGTMPGAQACASYSYNAANGYVGVTVSLDPEDLASGTEEYAAAALYHELFHAVVQYLSGGSVNSDDQHAAMYTHYLNLLGDALDATYPNMSPGDAQSLILKGLLNLDGGENPTNPDKWPTSLVNKVLSFSGYSRDQINAAYYRYASGDVSGTPCN